MSKPLWWKNAVKVIKDFTVDDAYMTFDCEHDDVFFLYHIRVEGTYITLEEIVSKDALSAPESVQKQLRDELHEGFRKMLMDYIEYIDAGM